VTIAVVGPKAWTIISSLCAAVTVSLPEETERMTSPRVIS
jgi:hypothetical protein